MNNTRLVHRALMSESIIGAALKVLNVLKPGLSGEAYENAMVIELRNRGHKVSPQERFDDRFEGPLIDPLIPDLIMDDLLIADPKVAEDFHPSHIAQMIGYPAVTDLKPAILLNFRCATLTWKRVIR
ncbi:MAG: GxxExxY protein [Verrucomicrobiota bacterium]